MSSILKALKKLEAAPVGKVNVQPLSQAVYSGRVIKEARQMRRYKTTFYLLLAIFLIGGGLFGGFHVVNKQSGEVVLFPVESLVPPVEEVGGGEVRSDGEIDRKMGTSPNTEIIPSSAAPIDIISASPQKGGTAETLRADKALELPTQAASAAEEKQHESTEEHKGFGNVADSISDSEQAVEGVPVVPSASGESVALQNEKDRSLPRLDYTAMQLQAITWGVQPRDRFVLVDNRILRKGDSINDYVIDSIQEEYVVVRQGGRRWRVEFRLR